MLQLKQIVTNRMAKNSIYLFIRMGLLMLINILAVRFVRSGLGVAEYGVFTAVNGIAQLVMCLNTVLASASQRYFSVALGKNDTEGLHSSFRVSVHLSWLISAVLLLVFETVGLWFVLTQMQYPPDRTWAVVCAYQAAVFTMVSLIIQVPYLSAVMAHEAMGVFAWVSVLEYSLRLLLAICLPWCPGDMLIIYSVGICLFSVVSTLLYWIYGLRKYPETHQTFFQSVPDKSLYSQMLSFSGWTMFGSVAGILMVQGNLLLLNVYDGPVINAAFAVSMQVMSAFLQLGNNIFLAVRPQMVMAYSEGNYSYLNRLFIRSSYLIFGLLLVVAIPLLIWMPQVLQLWLGDSDEMTTGFCRLMIINVMIQFMGCQFTTVMQAANRVREYHVVVELFTLACFPLSWLALAHDASPLATIWIMIGAFLLAQFVRVERVWRYYPEFPVRQYIVRFMLPALACVAAMLLF